MVTLTRATGPFSPCKSTAVASITYWPSCVGVHTLLIYADVRVDAGVRGLAQTTSRSAARHGVSPVARFRRAVPAGVEGAGGTRPPIQSRSHGALNAVTGPEHVLKALRAVKTGRVFDLGVPLDRRSYKWPGHSPTEVMSFRSPEGLKRGKDLGPFAADPKGLGFHSCALFISRAETSTCSFLSLMT